MTTALQLFNKVLNRLNKASVVASTFNAPVVKDHILLKALMIESQELLMNDLIGFEPQGVIGTQSISLTAVDDTNPLPTDLLDNRTKLLYVLDDDSEFDGEIEIISEMDFLRYQDVATNGNVKAYISGTDLKFTEETTTTQSLVLKYVKIPTALTTDTNVFSLPTAAEKLIVYKTLELFYEERDILTRMQTFNARYEMEKFKARASMNYSFIPKLRQKNQKTYFTGTW